MPRVPRQIKASLALHELKSIRVFIHSFPFHKDQTLPGAGAALAKLLVQSPAEAGERDCAKIEGGVSLGTSHVNKGGPGNTQAREKATELSRELGT